MSGISLQGLNKKEKKKLLELQITKCQHPNFLGGVDVTMPCMFNSQHSQKYNKILSNVHKIEGHMQCVNNHNARKENSWSFRLHKPDTI